MTGTQQWGQAKFTPVLLGEGTLLGPAVPILGLPQSGSTGSLHSPAGSFPTPPSPHPALSFFYREHPLTYWIISLFFTIYCSSCSTRKNISSPRQQLCLFCSVLYPKLLSQCLTYNWHLIKVCWMNEANEWRSQCWEYRKISTTLSGKSKLQNDVVDVPPLYKECVPINLKLLTTFN